MCTAICQDDVITFRQEERLEIDSYLIDSLPGARTGRCGNALGRVDATPRIRLCGEVNVIELREHVFSNKGMRL